MRSIVETLRFGWMRYIVDKYVYLKNRRNLKLHESFMLDLPSHTFEENRKAWDNYDWSQRGEEWGRLTPYGDKWKSILINEVMFKYIKNDSVILEIGPGAGKWTETLMTLAKRLILADISQTCLNICKDRFKAQNHIQYNLVVNRLDFIDSDSIDYIWSHDVFVHINPMDIERYIEDFTRILKPSGYAIIHHSGAYTNKGFRAHMTDKLFAQLVTKHGMKMVEQNKRLANRPGDVISIFTK